MDFQKMYAMDKYTTHESIGSIQCEPKYFDDPNRGDDRGFIQGCWCEHKPESNDHTFFYCIPHVIDSTCRKVHNSLDHFPNNIPQMLIYCVFRHYYVKKVDLQNTKLYRKVSPRE